MILLFLQRFHRFDVFLPSSFAEEKVPERVEALRNAQANGRWLTDLDVFFLPEIRRNKNLSAWKVTYENACQVWNFCQIEVSDV